MRTTTTKSDPVMTWEKIKVLVSQVAPACQKVKTDADKLAIKLTELNVNNLKH